MGDIEFRYRDDDELMHSSAGTTWQKKGAAYISRVKKNGKWVYTYAKNKASQAGNAAKKETEYVTNNIKRSTAPARSAVNNAYNASKHAVAVATSKQTRDNLNRQRRLTTSKVKGKVKRATKAKIAVGKAKVNELVARLKSTATNLDRQRRLTTSKVKGKVKRTTKAAANQVKSTASSAKKSVKRTVNSYTNPYSRKNTLRKAKVNNAKNKATSTVNNVKSSVKSGVTKTQTKITSAYNGVVSSSKKKRKNK